MRNNQSFVYKNIPTRYLNDWKVFFVEWLNTFYSLDLDLGVTISELDDLLNPFGETRLNRFFALSPVLSTEDLNLISDMVRFLNKDVTLDGLLALVRRVSGLDCTGRLAFGGGAVNESGDVFLDSGFRMDSGYTTDNVLFPYYIEIKFNVDKDTIDILGTRNQLIYRFLSVYKPVRLDVVIESQVDILSYGYNADVLSYPTMDSTYNLDSNVSLDFELEWDKNIEVFVKDEKIRFDFEDDVISFKATNGGNIRIEFLGQVFMDIDLPEYPYFSFLGSWECVLDTKKIKF